MLFVAEYELGWDSLETAIAKRLEWPEIAPDDFRFVSEYVWPAGDPPFRGIAVLEVDSTEALNAFLLHYGASVRFHVHPASDLMSALDQMGEGPDRVRRAPTPATRSKRKAEQRTRR